MKALKALKYGLQDALLQDFGLKVSPDMENISSLQDSDFPYCMIAFANSSINQVLFSTAAITIEQTLSIEFAVKADQSNYEDACLELLSELIPWISEARSKITGVCVVDSSALSYSIKGWNNSYCAGGAMLNCKFSIRLTRC